MRIVDGYNVIGAAARFGLSLAQQDKEDRLLRLLGAYRSRRRSRRALLVVFDGQYGRLAGGPRRHTFMGVDVEWTLGESADAAIARKVRTTARPATLEVVTSDRQLLSTIAGFGAKGTRSPDFLDAVEETLADDPVAEKPEEPSPADVDHWLKRFGDGR